MIRGECAFPCGCGQVGCVDTVGSARGLERLHRKRTAELLRAEAIIAGWMAGEAEAGETLALWRELVAGPLSMVVNVVGAEVVLALSVLWSMGCWSRWNVKQSDWLIPCMASAFSV